MKSFKKLLVVAMVALGVLIGVQSTSYAITLFLSDGTSSVFAIDGGLNDSNSVLGAVTFNGSLGGWTVNVTTGITYPALGSTSSPILDLNSVNVSSSGAGTLYIWASQTGYNGGGPGAATFVAGGTTTGTLNFSSYFDNTNSLWGTGGLIGTLAFSSSPFSGSTSGSVSATGPFSLTTVATITHTGAGYTSFNATTTVPEPSTMLLFGFGLLGLWGFGRKFKK